MRPLVAFSKRKARWTLGCFKSRRHSESVGGANPVSRASCCWDSPVAARYLSIRLMRIVDLLADYKARRKG